MVSRFNCRFGAIVLTCLALLPLAKLPAIIPGVKSLGMGGSGLAYPIDAESGILNPALQVWVGNRLQVGLTPIVFQGSTIISNNGNPAVNGTYNCFEKGYIYNPNFAVSYNFPCMERRVSVGAVLYNNQEAFVRYGRPVRILGTSNPQLEYFQEVFAPMASVKINDWQSLGLAFNMYFQRLAVQGLENFKVASSNPSEVTNRGPSLSTGFGATIGWYAHVMRGISVALTYTPRASMSAFRYYGGFIAEHGKLDVPARLAGGLCLRFSPCLAWTFDVMHEGYNKIRALNNKLVLPNPIVGYDNGTGFGWRDRTYYRTGIDYKVNKKLNVRLGFRHARCPVPSSQTATNALTAETVENLITTGLTYKITECVDFSFFYAHGFKYQLKGDSNSIPTALGGGQVDISQSLDAFGFAFGIGF